MRKKRKSNQGRPPGRHLKKLRGTEPPLLIIGRGDRLRLKKAERGTGRLSKEQLAARGKKARYSTGEQKTDGS